MIFRFHARPKTIFPLNYLFEFANPAAERDEQHTSGRDYGVGFVP